MIWILTTILILLWCKNSSHRFQKLSGPCAVSKQRVSPFYRPSIHQISTLEKTKFYQYSILSSLMSVRIQRVSPFYRTSQFADSEEFDFRVWLSPGLSDAVEGSTSEALSLHRETKFIIGFDFALTLSSPESFLRSFGHYFRTICRTEIADVKQTQKMIPSITCEISLGQNVCELVFGVNICNLDFRVQIDSIKQPIKSNSVGSGNMSHCRTSTLYNHLDHCFVVFKHIQQSFLMRKLDV